MPTSAIETLPLFEDPTGAEVIMLSAFVAILPEPSLSCTAASTQELGKMLEAGSQFLLCSVTPETLPIILDRAIRGTPLEAP